MATAEAEAAETVEVVVMVQEEKMVATQDQELKEEKTEARTLKVVSQEREDQEAEEEPLTVREDSSDLRVTDLSEVMEKEEAAEADQEVMAKEDLEETGELLKTRGPTRKLIKFTSLQLF